MSTAKLTYFDGRGRAEVIRLTMAAAGIHWTQDNIVNKADMDKIRSSKKLMFNQLPLLEIDGLNLVQSDAIVRYLGAKYNLLGGICPATEKPEVAAKMNMLYCGARDFYELGFLGYGFVPYAQALETAKTKAIPKYMPVFEKVLHQSKGGFLLGDKLTIADIALLEVLLLINELCHEDLDRFPAVKAFFDKMVSLPKISAYLNGDQRPRINDDRYVKEVKDSLEMN